MHKDTLYVRIFGIKVFKSQFKANASNLQTEASIVQLDSWPVLCS